MEAPVHSNPLGTASVIDIDSDSDYGSDFSLGEERLVEEILAGLEAGNTAIITTQPTSATTASPAQQAHNAGSRAPAQSADAHHLSHATDFIALELTQPLPANDEGTITPRAEQGVVSLDSVRYPDLSRALSGLESENKSAQPEPPAGEDESDTRTPLQRFRTFPKRPLTVSDFAAGAWCELQHWYTLTRLPGGKKTVTVAMKGGSRVHQTLEDEVHSIVQVSIATKEEAFALRLWNIIQGLRTLRDTGMTRELEVWGIVEGEVLNGVIDQVSYNSPNTGFEKELSEKEPSLHAQQSSITEYMGSSQKMVYLTDVKTRGSNRLPTGKAVRPARVQLLLYRQMLSDMAADKLDYSLVFNRYGLNGEARFSDGFMAQVGNLHDEVFYDAQSEVEGLPNEKTPPDLIAYRSISQIVPLLKAELKETFPLGPASISNLLSVEYRHRTDGRHLGNNAFPADQGAIDEYTKYSLEWWRGERKPEGVNIEETYKCGFCEFAESCQWRKDKELEYLKKKRKAKSIAKAV
ncbi:hypothetical protein NPX13_g9994 [Xylaria arbuscula]|uniref:Exonuclease V n=1 Tax=Xylaria arbuscula TaxID=114810 RepID=A0A9W8THW3_9PEZI|nr:hypothetical protein NPX13_g9994 [Xylaria arbuscula]